MADALATRDQLRACILCDGAMLKRDGSAVEAECVRCGAVNDVVDLSAPVRGTKSPALDRFEAVGGLKVETALASAGALDPYRGVASKAPASVRVSWSPRGVLFGMVALAAMLTPLVWLVSPYLVLPYAALALITFGALALDRYELTRSGGSISLEREGLPLPSLGPFRELDAFGEVVPEPIPPTRATHVAVCRLALPASGRSCYGLAITDERGRIRRYRLTMNRDRAVAAWRALYEGLPELDALPAPDWVD